MAEVLASAIFVKELSRFTGFRLAGMLMLPKPIEIINLIFEMSDPFFALGAITSQYILFRKI
jgi:hypothetical protein